MKYLSGILFIFFLIILDSCGVPQEDFEKLRTENTELKNDIEGLQKLNAELKLELEECMVGADKLLSKAISYFDDEEYYKSRPTLKLLLEKHPGSSESKKAEELLKKVNFQIDKIDKDKIKREEDRKRKEKQRLANATSKMRKKYDDIEGITWYRDKTSPRHSNYNGFYAYFGKKNTGSPWLRLVIQYAADDWLFIESYIIKVDGKTYNITEDEYGEIETDNGSGGIWEWLDRNVESDEFEIIKSVANGKDVKIRFNGKQYYKDKTITSKQKLALRNVLDAYEALGGTMR